MKIFNLKNKLKIYKLIVCFILIFYVFSYTNTFFASNDINFNINSNDNINFNINSRNVILSDNETGQILYSNGQDKKIYPASTTKILTAILALEKGKISDVTVATASAINSMPEGSSTSGIKVGEVLSIKDVLYCLLLQSANEGANVIAEYVSGNVQDFVKLMNSKAKEIGCKNTNFVNAHGFHDDNHYTTPEDMMIILRYAMKNSDFREIMEAKYYTVQKTNLSDERKLVNTNRLTFTSDEIGNLSHYYKYALGGKTGYTYEAERTFVGYAKKDNKTLLVGVFGGFNILGNDGRYIDAVNLFEYGFNNFNYSQVLKRTSSFKITDFTNKKIYTVSLLDDLLLLRKNNESGFKIKYDLDKTIIDNIKDKEINQEVGSIVFDISYDNYIQKIEKKLVVTDVQNIYSIKSLKDFLVSDQVLYIVRIVAFVLMLITGIATIIIVYKDRKTKFYLNSDYENIIKKRSGNKDGI